MVVYDRNHSNDPIIFTMDRDVRRDESVFTISDAGLINLRDIAHSRNGEIAVVGSAYTSDNQGACFIARISADRQHQTVKTTSPYCALVVTFASDDTIWTIGPSGIWALNILQRFDQSGRMLASVTLQVKGARTQSTSYLRSSRDRVVWFTRDGEYVEWSLDGTEIGRYSGPKVSAERDITGL